MVRVPITAVRGCVSVFCVKPTQSSQCRHKRSLLFFPVVLIGKQPQATSRLCLLFLHLVFVLCVSGCVCMHEHPQMNLSVCACVLRGTCVFIGARVCACLPPSPTQTASSRLAAANFRWKISGEEEKAERKRWLSFWDFRLDWEVDVTVLDFPKKREEAKGIREERGLRVKKKKNIKQKSKKTTQLTERVNKYTVERKKWLWQVRKWKSEEGMWSGKKKRRNTARRMRARKKCGGGINQNVRITARCLNFEKGSIWG